VTLNDSYNLDAAIDFSSGKITVNSTQYPTLNRSATITMYNLQIRDVRLLRDGVECSPSICQNISNDLDNSQITFDVTGFTDYEAEEANQSKIDNNKTDSLDAWIYLLMKVQYYNTTTSQWVDDDTVYDGTSPVNISAGSILKLDEYFNGKWNTTANASFGDGTYRVYAAATDENNLVLENINGTWLNTTFNFTINTTAANTPPAIQITSPEDSSYLNTATITINGTSTDTDLNYTNISLYNASWTLINSTLNYSSDWSVVLGGATPDGIYYINATAYDNASNSNTTGIVVLVDTTPPSITDVADNSPKGFGVNVTINATVNDSIGVDTVLIEITLPNGTTLANDTMTNVSSTFYQYNYTDWLNGTYNYTIYANDTTGNWNTSSDSFTLYVNMSIQVRTLKDVYGANEIVNLTDPPGFTEFSILLDALLQEPQNNPKIAETKKDNISFYEVDEADKEFFIVLNPVTEVRDGGVWTISFNTAGSADLRIDSPNAGWTEYPSDNTETFDEMTFHDLKCGNTSLQPAIRARLH
jgi:hypothetical protein